MVSIIYIVHPPEALQAFISEAYQNKKWSEIRKKKSKKCKNLMDFK